MDDESIINEDGTAFNGNWRAVLLAFAILVFSGIYLVCRAIGLTYDAVMGLF